MHSRMRSGYRSVTVAGLLLAASALATMARAQDPVSQPASTYLVLEHRAASGISAGDAAILQEKQKQIETEAAMFGYDLSVGEWNYDQTECPAIPDGILLHYRSTARNGGQSLFTAVVPRGEGRVWVVPILYRGATPFQSATGQDRTISVFNHVVPAAVAKQFIQPDGHWLALGMCYSEIAGAEPRVPQNTDEDAGLLRAPEATLNTAEGRGAQEIRFTGREEPSHYTVWSITVNGDGRVLSAETRTFVDAASPFAEENAPTTAVNREIPAAAPPAVVSARAEPARAQPVPATPAQPAEAATAAAPAPEPAANPSSASAPAAAFAAVPATPAPAASPGRAASVTTAAETSPVVEVRNGKRAKTKVKREPSDPKVIILPDLPDPPVKIVPQ